MSGSPANSSRHFWLLGHQYEAESPGQLSAKVGDPIGSKEPLHKDSGAQKTGIGGDACTQSPTLTVESSPGWHVQFFTSSLSLLGLP